MASQYATIIYKASYKTDMITPIIRSLCVDLVFVLLMIFGLGRLIQSLIRQYLDEFPGHWLYCLVLVSLYREHLVSKSH